MTVETLEEQQSTRNRLLMRFAEDLHLVENRGSGINTMLNEMRKAIMEPPIFQDTRTAFRVTFYNRHLLAPETCAWLDTFASKQLNEQQRMALAFLRHRGRITNSDYRRLNFVDTITATRDLRGLVQAEIIIQHDSRRWTFYSLASAMPDGSDQLELPAIPGKVEEQIITFLRQYGEITNESCRNLLHVEKWRAAVVLKQLTTDGILQKIGTTGRNVKYILVKRR